MNEVTVKVEGKIKSGKSWVVQAIAEALETKLGAQVTVQSMDLTVDAYSRRKQKMRSGEFNAESMGGLRVIVKEVQLPRTPHPTWVKKFDGDIGDVEGMARCYESHLSPEEREDLHTMEGHTLGAIVFLTRALRTLQEGLGLNLDLNKDAITIPLTMSDNDWVELINAVSSKWHSLERGEHIQDMTETQVNEWVNQLERTYGYLAEELDRRGITY